MNHLEHEAISQLLVQQFVKKRLPQIIRLRDEVVAGKCLTEGELALMEQALERARGLMPGSGEFPEYDTLFAKCISLYGEIAEAALRNEQNQN